MKNPAGIGTESLNQRKIQIQNLDFNETDDFLYKLIVYIVLDYDYCILYFATRKWPLALCCLINE